jgi:putative transposase
MKRSRFSEQQIAFILHQAEEGVAVEEVCRKAGISLQTYYRWRKKYGGLMPSEMKRLKLLEEENARLKKLVADLSLDKAMLQDVVKRNAWSASPLQGFSRRAKTVCFNVSGLSRVGRGCDQAMMGSARAVPNKLGTGSKPAFLEQAYDTRIDCRHIVSGPRKLRLSCAQPYAGSRRW